MEVRAVPERRPTPSTSACTYCCTSRSRCCCATASGRSRRGSRSTASLAGLTLAALAAGTVFDLVRAADRGQRRGRRDDARLPRLRPAAARDGARARFAATAWRPGARWWLLGGGLIVCALADTFFIFQESTGAYEAGAWLDNLWPAAVAAIALAAWQRTAPPSRAARRLVDGRGAARSPSAVVDRHAAVRGPHHGGTLTVVLAGAALFAGIARAAADARARTSRCCADARREALTDKLTELPNRRALLHDLEVALLDPAARTRSCSSTSTASRTTTTPSATRPATRCSAGSPPRSRRRRRAYRLGGDEFCLLIDGAVGDGRPVGPARGRGAQRARRRVSRSAPPTGSSCCPRTPPTRPRRCASRTSACTRASAAAAAAAARRPATCS